MKKQETLEKAAKDYSSKITDAWGIDEACNVAFKEVAKWQQERSYSEEDLKQFAFECVANFLSNNKNKIEVQLADVIIDRNNQQFEQFKNK